MIKVLLVDDMSLIRKSIKSLIHNARNINIIGECKNGQEAIDFVKQNQTDVILMDIVMPKLDGFKATKIIMNLFPEIKIIAHSSHNDDDYVKKMLEAGAVDYLIKTQCQIELIDAIHNAYFD
tara:strand:+ start:4021 stop:4386 length:366 start_codon:yes stop_codon:yes gene_type:complete